LRNDYERLLRARKHPSLFPNPINEQFMVATSEVGVLEVWSMTGQLLLNQAISKGETNVSLSGQAKGTYMVRITCGEHATHKRIVIQYARGLVYAWLLFARGQP
jgi:hypothetical protein